MELNIIIKYLQHKKNFECVVKITHTYFHFVLLSYFIKCYINFIFRIYYFLAWLKFII